MLITSDDIYHSGNIFDYLKRNQDLLALKPLNFEPEQTILHQGQENDVALFIVDGTISLSRQTEHGRRYQIGTFKHNGFLGLMELFSGKSCFYSVYAKSSCQAYVFNGKKFTQLVYQTPELSAFVFKHITTKWYLSVDRMTRNILHSIKYCVIDDLLTFDVENPGKAFEINKSLECERLGTTLRVYNRILRQLQDVEAIDVERRAIKVINREVLEQEFEKEIDK